ncbi:hypothetical protein JB92DRAFT_2854704, partial [Gautieria morchelliformis]
MERNVIACLDDIPLIKIQHYANQSAIFISAYTQGFSGSMACLGKPKPKVSWTPDFGWLRKQRLPMH